MVVAFPAGGGVDFVARTVSQRLSEALKQSMPPVVAHAKAGKLRVLAVTSDKRSAAMPDVPAVAEFPGFAGYRFTNWMGVFVPAKTPPQIVQRLAAEVARIVRERRPVIAGPARLMRTAT